MTNSGGDTFTATIPGAAAGTPDPLPRRGHQRHRHQPLSPRSTTPSSTAAWSCPHGITSPIPVLEWFIADADYTDDGQQPRAADIIRDRRRSPTTAQVIDNVEVEIKGHASQTRPEGQLEVPHCRQGHDLDMAGLLAEPVDEFDMQADWSDKSHGRAILSWDAYRACRDREPPDVPDPHPAQRRLPGPLQPSARSSTAPGASARATTTTSSSRPRPAPSAPGRPTCSSARRPPTTTDFAPISAFINGVRLTGTAQRNYLLANADLPEMINYAAVTAIIEHHDSSSKNFYLVAGPDHQSLVDPPVGPRPHLGQRLLQRQQHVRDPGRARRQHQRPDARASWPCPSGATMYFRRLRTLVNDILATGRMEALYDANLSAGPADRGPGLSRPGPTRATPTATRRSARGSSTTSRPDATSFAVGLAGAGQPARGPEHRDRRDPALPDRR